ncbi:MAG: hypothetical protein QM718_15860 [Steroidobacteraceae bacterium]
MFSRKRVVPALAMVGLLAGSVQAAEYWGVSYKNIEVTAAGSEKNALTLVSNLQRLDTALANVLTVDLGSDRPQLYIYSLPMSVFQQVKPKHEEFGSLYSANELDADMLINSNAHTDRRYFGAYFGYAGSLLTLNAGVSRYPEWFRIGIAEVFAATSMDDDEVTLGGYESNQVQQLYLARSQGKFLPAETLLTLQHDDPHFKSQEYRSLYQSQCWLLAHLVVIEGQMRDAFNTFLGRVSGGEDAATAFAASFPGGYASIDTLLNQALTAGRLRSIIVKVPVPSIDAQPRRLSEAQMNGRLAQMAVRSDQLDAGLALAAQTLKSVPDDEYALRAELVGNMRKEQYAEVWRLLQTLQTREDLSERGSAEVAAMWARLAELAPAKLPAGLEQSVLQPQAMGRLEQVVARNPDDLRSWDLLANLYGLSSDRTAATAFAKRAEQVFYRHSSNAMLAAALARLYARQGNFSDAFKFAVAWHNLTPGEAGRNAASNMMRNLQQAMARNGT